MLPEVKRFAPALLALLLAAWPLAAQQPNRNVRFGLPSSAKADPRQREDYLSGAGRAWRTIAVTSE